MIAALHLLLLTLAVAYLCGQAWCDADWLIYERDTDGD